MSNHRSSHPSAALLQTSAHSTHSIVRVVTSLLLPYRRLQKTHLSTQSPPRSPLYTFLSHRSWLHSPLRSWLGVLDVFPATLPGLFCSVLSSCFFHPDLRRLLLVVLPPAPFRRGRRNPSASRRHRLDQAVSNNFRTTSGQPLSPNHTYQTTSSHLQSAKPSQRHRVGEAEHVGRTDDDRDTRVTEEEPQLASSHKTPRDGGLSAEVRTFHEMWTTSSDDCADNPINQRSVIVWQCQVEKKKTTSNTRDAKYVNACWRETRISGLINSKAITESDTWGAKLMSKREHDWTMIEWSIWTKLQMLLTSEKMTEMKMWSAETCWNAFIVRRVTMQWGKRASGHSSTYLTTTRSESRDWRSQTSREDVRQDLWHKRTLTEVKTMCSLTKDAKSLRVE